MSEHIAEVVSVGTVAEGLSGDNPDIATLLRSDSDYTDYNSLEEPSCDIEKQAKWASEWARSIIEGRYSPDIEVFTQYYIDVQTFFYQALIEYNNPSNRYRQATGSAIRRLNITLGQLSEHLNSPENSSNISPKTIYKSTSSDLRVLATRLMPDSIEYGWGDPADVFETILSRDSAFTDNPSPIYPVTIVDRSFRNMMHIPYNLAIFAREVADLDSDMVFDDERQKRVRSIALGLKDSYEVMFSGYDTDTGYLTSVEKTGIYAWSPVVSWPIGHLVVGVSGDVIETLPSTPDSPEKLSIAA